MKKRILALVLGTFLLFGTLNSDLVSRAEGVENSTEPTISEETVEIDEDDEIDETITKQEDEVDEVITKKEEEETTVSVDTSELLEDTVLNEDVLLGSKVSENTAEINEISAESVKVYTNDKALDGNSGEIEINSGTVFKVSYTFGDLELNTDENSLKTGTSYKVTPGITGLSQFDLKDEIKVDVTDETGTVYGYITVTPNQDEATIYFTPTYEGAGTLTGGNFAISFKLETDNNKLSKRKNIAFPDGNTYSFVLSDLVTTPPTLSISGSISDDPSIANWKVDIKNAITPAQYDKGYSVQIKLSNGEKYVDRSCTAGEVTYDTKNNILYIKLTEPSTVSNEVTSISYQTSTDFPLTKGIVESNSNAITAKLVDTANLVANDKTINEKPVSAEVSTSKSLTTWMTKDGGTVDANGLVDWTLTVNNNGYTLNDVVVYDAFDTGVMTLVDNSVTISKEGAKVDVASGKDINGNAYTWKFELGTLSGNESVTIKYQTKINDYKEYQKQNHTSKPVNNAWLTYTYPFGTEPGTFVGPTVSKEANVNLQSGIHITGAGVNVSTHELTWKVTVNQGFQNVSDIVVYDIIPDGQEYVGDSISDIKLTSIDGSSSTMSAQFTADSSNRLKLVLGDNLNGKKAEFTFKTKLTDAEAKVWSDNKSGNYKNSVELEQKGYKDNQKHSATQGYSSTVLTTVINNYDYNNHTVDVVVEVDANQMDMADTVVTNNLKYDGYEFVVNGPISVNGEELSKEDYSTNDEGNLVVKLGSINEKKTIKFNAIVKSDNYEKVNNATFDIKNQAYLKTADTEKISSGYQVAKATGNLTIKNSTLLKEGRGDSATGVANYTVYINKARNKLAEGTKVTDVLGSSLELDTLSVALYECELSANGEVVMPASPLSSDKYKVTTAIDSATNKTVMDVTIPATDKVYVLKYSAQVTDLTLKDCSNNISMYMATGSSAASASLNLKASFKAGATFKGATYLNIKAVDEAGKVLSGVGYGVYDSNDNLILKTITKSDGVAKIISTKLKENETYTVKEINGPATYDPIKDGKTTGKIVLGNSSSPKEVEFKYIKKSTTLNIFNRIDSEEGDLLAGSELSLYKDGNLEKTWTSVQDKEATRVYVDSTYVLKDKAPLEYRPGKDITFKVVENADGEVVVQQFVDGNYKEVSDINMVNVTKNRYNVAISKVSDATGELLEGATLVISTDKDGKNVVETRKTAGTVVDDVNLPEGDYYLIETNAPVGFKIAEPIAFTLSEDTEITMVDKYQQKDEASGITGTYTTFTLTPESLGMTPELFDAFGIKLFKVDPISGELTDDILTDEDGNYLLEYQSTYVIKPTKDVPGYNPLEPITFKVVGNKDENDKVVDTIKVVNKDNTYSEVSLEDIAESMTPARVIVPVYYGESSNGNGSSSEGTAAGSNNGLILKDNEIIAGADLANGNANANAAATLAKTGGFVGTVLAYITALACILLGLYMVFGKKKNYDKENNN